MTIRIGAPCPQCRSVVRYISDNRCVPCRRASGRKVHANRKKAKADGRAGLPSRFIQFGTLAHFVLKLALRDQYVSNRSIKRELANRPQDFEQTPSAVSATLKRLVECRFLYEVGIDREPGSRSFKVFSLNYRDKMSFVSVDKLSHKERTKKYRELKKVKVSNVFDWRGSYESKLPE